MISELQNYTEIEKRELYQLRKEQIARRRTQLKLIKHKLKSYFDFDIVDYIIDDILENEEYQHFCLMVNLAVVNRRMTEEQGETLKEGIKELFEIEKDTDKLDVDMILDGYDDWYSNYHSKMLVDINKYLSKENKATLKKLSVKVKNKVLTNYEYDDLRLNVLQYYSENDEDLEGLDLSFCKSLAGTGVSDEEYQELINVFDRISADYGIF